MVAYTDSKIDEEIIENSITAYQEKKNLNMEEIWSLSTFLNICLIENIRRICEKIYISQIQKEKVEDIVNRLIDGTQIDKKTINKNKFYGGNSYSFIEYMSYKLKQYGKKGIAYLKILQQEVNKTGITVDDAIKKEHFFIAMQKVSIGNSITTIRELGRINFLNLFEKINGVEDILNLDPANVYSKMDYKTKEVYRHKIKIISSKLKLSENYVATKILEIATDGSSKKEKHIGYYLIGDGRKELFKILNCNKKIHTKIQNFRIYINSIWILTIIFALCVGIVNFYATKKIIYSIIFALLAFIPVSEIVIQFINYLLGKIIKPTLIPKMNFQNGIPETASTMIVIPTIVSNASKVQEMFNKLEIYYCANKLDNLYFTLLGDCTSSKNETYEKDEEIIKKGQECAKELNEKYNKNIFGFIYRKRTWNSSEESYLGWERKRGLIIQLNEFLITGKDEFKFNTIKEKLQIKYIITLDADTELVLGSAQELIGAMEHILNKPVVKNGIVVEGYGLLQPRIGINLVSSKKSLFTRVFAGAGGTDSYTNAISDIYQDNFEEGIFTGKGIYNLKLFYQLLDNEIPENTVLSHDLLEGSYLRCGLASDILLLDGFPTKYNSFLSRLHRWTRGDWQICRWLGEKSHLNSISKFKILDNLRRSLLPIMVLILFMVSIYTKNIGLWIFALVSYLIPNILDLLNYIVFKKEVNQNFVFANKNLSKVIGTIQGSVIRGFLELISIPTKACMLADAILRSTYRMKISKKHLLEWTTSEEMEKLSKTDLKSSFVFMKWNVFFGILTIFVGTLNLNIFVLILGLFWLMAPEMIYEVSKEYKEEIFKNKLNKDEQQYLKEIGKKTWRYFEKYITEENNFLPPDNYQEDRKEKIALRTSPTNMGLGLLSVCAASDLGYISINKSIEIITNMVNTIIKLPKLNGHLYNWYNIKTLEPLFPRYISTVDNGNFIGYLFTLKQFLLENNADKNMILEINKIIENTNFASLYDKKKDIFSIGFNVEENQLTDSYYDLLASEARQTSLIAIAKKDIPQKHWNMLSRTLTTLDKYKGLISWSGTAFEYLMPNINVKSYEGSLLDESCKFMVMSQQIYSKKLKTPWGISEAAFNLRDLNNNYQYKAFGIPWLGLKRGLIEDNVVSSYAIFLSLKYAPKEAIKNLKILEEQGMYNKFGFYESIDYTTSRLSENQNYETIKTYMAHHQGLILLSIDNFLNNDVLVNRFSKNPQIAAIDILLQERMPEKAIITKEKKEKIDKLKVREISNYAETVYKKLNDIIMPSNIISNGNYMICINLKGEGFSKCGNILINRYKKTADYKQGIFIYIKNVNSKKIWNSFPETEKDLFRTIFAPDKVEVRRQEENIETNLKIVVAPDDNVELRRLKLKNNGLNEELLEITSYFEPVISTPEQDYAHMAFNNLFLKFEKTEKGIIIQRKKREADKKELFVGTAVYTENEIIGEEEFEIDKEKFIGKCNLGLPEMIENSKGFSKNLSLVTDAILANKKTIKIMPNQEITIDLIICISENKEITQKLLEKYENVNMNTKIIELSKAKQEAENRYLSVTGEESKIYEKILSLIMTNNPLRQIYLKNFKDNEYSQSELWKYGISGDVPIILAKIQEISDIEIIKNILKAYEFIKSKGINIDLIILNEEKNSYDSNLKYEIEYCIQNKQLAYLKNQFGGIFIINKREIQTHDVELFELRANLIIDASLGTIENQIKDLEEEYYDNMQTGKVDNKYVISDVDEPIDENYNNLKYYNEYGGFSENGQEYIIKLNNKLPVVWCNILANEQFGTLTTQNFGGFTWRKNSRLNRISAWNNEPNIDIPSEIIYFQDKENGKVWTLSNNLNKSNQDFKIVYGFGYTKIKTLKDDIVHEVQTFVARNDSIKINIIELKNKSKENKKLKLIYYVNPVLGEDEVKSTGYIKVEKEANGIFIKNLYTDEFKNQIVYVSSNEKINSYTGNKDEFMGRGNILNPEAIYKNKLSDSNGLGARSCVAIQIDIELESYENKEIILIFGAEDEKISAKNMIYKYSKIQNCKEELIKIQNYWYELLTRVHVTTPLESLNILLNGWAAYQTITSRLWAKTGYYQSGGAIGFRDQLQDTLGLKCIDINFMKEQILMAAKHQFKEGDVEHWWHEETSRGIRTRFSDDLLWLCYVTAEYINFTGDMSILEINVSYLQGEKLPDNLDEKYDYYCSGEFCESIYNHCIRAIDKAINLGDKGLPKIGSGDWNDGLNTIGNKNKGQSIWLGFFLYEVLNRFIPICKQKQDFEKVKEYEEIMQKLKKSLNSNGWDGRWFRRAYNDEGEAIGSIENEECKIDSISQSWGVISGAADNDKKYISMESVETHLIDKENGIIKLLDPPFNKSKLEPGYIKSYPPGVRENGGQYTHAAMWFIFAFTKLGFGDKAIEYYRMINPIEHSRTKETANKYKVEPYVIPADIYGAENIIGRGGWTWYTGSSSWFLKTGLEEILGLKIEKMNLRIEPCISKEWKEYSIKYRYKNTIYDIKIKNPNGKNTGVEKFIVNGKEVKEKQIKLEENSGSVEIEVIM